MNVLDVYHQVHSKQWYSVVSVIAYIDKSYYGSFSTTNSTSRDNV